MTQTYKHTGYLTCGFAMNPPPVWKDGHQVHEPKRVWYVSFDNLVTSSRRLTYGHFSSKQEAIDWAARSNVNLIEE
jgi:hypothetical protein